MASRSQPASAWHGLLSAGASHSAEMGLQLFLYGCICLSPSTTQAATVITCPS